MSELDEEEFFAGLDEPDTRSTRKQFADEIKRGEVVAVQDESEEEQALRERGGRAIRPVEVEDGRQTLFMRTPESLPGAAAREADTAERVQRDIRGMDYPGGVNPGALASDFATGATFGHADELAGAVGAAAGQGYERTRDRARQIQGALRREHPGSSALGTGLGVVATLPFLPTLAGRAATGLGRVGMAGLEGLGYGAVGGSGASEADVGTQEFAEDVGLGAGLGAVAGGAVGGVGEGARAVLSRNPGALRDAASVRRVRGLFGADRPRAGDLQQVVGAGGPAQQGARARGVLETAQRRGLRGLDDAEEVVGGIGEELGGVARQIDEDIATRAGFRENPVRRAVDVEDIARQLDDQATALEGRGAPDSALNTIRERASRWRRTNPTFDDAWAAQRRMRDPGSHDVLPSGRLSVAGADERAMYETGRQGLREAVERTAPELGPVWQQGASDYSALVPLRDASRTARMRAATNRQVSPTDYAAGLVGAATGNPVAALGGVMANKLLRGSEHRLVGSGMETLARVIERQPQRLGQYGTVLQQAMQRGPGAYAATFFTMSQNDPAFRQAVTRAEDDLENPDAADEEPDEAQYMSEEDFFEGFEE